MTVAPTPLRPVRFAYRPHVDVGRVLLVLSAVVLALAILLLLKGDAPGLQS